MAGWLARERQTFFRVSGEIGSHLNVVLCDPRDFPTYRSQSVIVVDICSVRQTWHDTTTVVDVGDHPFLRHASYVNYRQARVDHAADLEKLVGARGYESSEPIDQELLVRILRGAIESANTQRDIKSFIRNL